MPLQTHTVTVTGYGSGGDGITRLDDGRVVFIRNAARGDVLEVRLIKEQARSAHADIVRIIEPSLHRIEPDCRHYPQCGGCDFRHLTYDEELYAKLNRVNDALERIGGSSARVGEVLHTDRIGGYRNKAVFHADGDSMGFYKAGSHEVIPIDRCLLLKDDLNDAFESLRQDLHPNLRQNLRPNHCPNLSQNLSQNLNPNLNAGGEITLRSGRNGLDDPLEEELDGLVFGISGFFQVNTDAALILYNKAREYAALSKDETLIDLYCGVGSLTLFLGRDARYALGVEIAPEAVKAARENARWNGMKHVEFICADASAWESDLTRPDCIVVDPPRKGLSPQTKRKIIELSPGRIVYVSCDPATLARDIRELDGYEVAEICAVDMFPRTANVETCCLLKKRT